jgi:hypothetical protein
MPTEDTIRKALTALHEGKTLNNLAGRKGDKYAGDRIIETQTIERFCDAHPKIGKRIRAMAEKNKIRAISEPNPVTTAKPSIVRVSDDIMDVISTAVPRHLPRDLRDDAIQNISMAVLEGRLKRNEIVARARIYQR